MKQGTITYGITRNGGRILGRYLKQITNNMCCIVVPDGTKFDIHNVNLNTIVTQEDIDKLHNMEDACMQATSRFYADLFDGIDLVELDYTIPNKIGK